MGDFLYGYQADEFIDGQYYNGDYVPTEQDYIDMNEQWGNEFQEEEQLFCANCGHVELVGNAQSPDSSLCCDCYKYNSDDQWNDDYQETEADTYQDAFYDDYPEMDW